MSEWIRIYFRIFSVITNTPMHNANKSTSNGKNRRKEREREGKSERSKRRMQFKLEKHNLQCRICTHFTYIACHISFILFLSMRLPQHNNIERRKKERRLDYNSIYCAYIPLLLISFSNDAFRQKCKHFNSKSGKQTGIKQINADQIVSKCKRRFSKITCTHFDMRHMKLLLL